VSIQGYACAETERLFQTGKSRRFANILAVATRKLDMLNAATSLADLRLPPGNQLEALQGDRAGQHSIRINRQWRVCFVWTTVGPDRVEIVDYH
jgi:proteic killer suppression protein